MASARHSRLVDASMVEATNTCNSSSRRGAKGISRKDFESSNKKKRNTRRSVGRSSSEEVMEEGSDEDGDEDSGNQGGNRDDNDGDDDEDDTEEVRAPSGGLGKSKGRRPVSNIEGAASHKTLRNRRAGLPSKSNSDSGSSGANKRSFSSIDVPSAIHDFGVNGNESTSPPSKAARRLSSFTGDINDLGAHEIFGENAPAIVEEVVETEDGDDDYEGVELISDSDEDDTSVERLEEQAIIESEEEVEQPSHTSLTSSDANNGFHLGAEIVFPPENLFFEEQFQRGHIHLAHEASIVADPEPKARKHSESSGRRVHFDDDVRGSDTASTLSTEQDLSLYPDLTLLETGIGALNASHANSDDIAWHSYPQSGSSDGSSYWDFHEDLPPAAPETESEFEMAETSSSGYESDTGDTTDEDLPPETTVHTPGALLHRRPSSSSADFSGRSRLTSRYTNRPLPHQKPRLASWKVDPKKTIAIIDSTGKRMLLFPARDPGSNNPWTESTASTISNQSPQTPFQALTTDESDPSDFSGHAIGSPDIMLNGIFGSGLFGNQIVGPPEAFYPFTNFDANGTVIDSDDEVDMDDLSDNEQRIRLKDIIDCGDDTDEELDTAIEQDTTTDAAEATDVPETPSLATPFNSRPSSSYQSPQSARRSMTDDMLSHFDRGIVNSFRANQNRCRQVLRHGQQQPAIRSSISRPLRNGRNSDALMTPVRKRRNQGSVDMKGSPIGKKLPVAGTFGRATLQQSP